MNRSADKGVQSNGRMLLGAAAMSLVFAMACGWGLSLEEGHNENGSHDWPGVHRRHPGHVGRLRGHGVGEYLDFDLRVTWRPRDFIECALVGRNLGSAQRIEFSQSQNIATIVSEVQRGVYGQVSMRF